MGCFEISRDVGSLSELAFIFSLFVIIQHLTRSITPFYCHFIFLAVYFNALTEANSSSYKELYLPIQYSFAIYVWVLFASCEKREDKIGLKYVSFVCKLRTKLIDFFTFIFDHMVTSSKVSCIELICNVISWFIM